MTRLAPDHEWKKQRRWAWRSGQLEVGSCDERLSYSGPQVLAEISQWADDDRSRWVIAVFRPKKDGGWDLEIMERALKANWRDLKRCSRVGFMLLRGQSL